MLRARGRCRATTGRVFDRGAARHSHLPAAPGATAISSRSRSLWEGIALRNLAGHPEAGRIDRGSIL